MRQAYKLPLVTEPVAAVQVLAALFGSIVPDAMQLVRKQLKETVPTCNHNLVMSCFNLMDSLLQPYIGQEGATCLQHAGPCSAHSLRSIRAAAAADHI